MKVHKQGSIVGLHYDGDYLTVAICFEGIFEPVKNIDNITLCGALLDDFPELIKYNVHDGTQTEVDKVLLENIPEWEEDRIMSGCPYIAIHAIYKSGVFEVDKGITVWADVTFVESGE